MISIIILIVSLLLDGLLTNFIPFIVNDLSLFTPLFTVVSIFIIYPFYRKKEKKYFITIFILGIIYDLMYTNNLFLNAIIFLIIGLFTKLIYKNFTVNYIKLILYTIIIIISYESLLAFILLIFNVVPITLSKLIYKITHTIILNVIYIELVYLIINKIPNKYKKISIN